MDIMLCTSCLFLFGPLRKKCFKSIYITYVLICSFLLLLVLSVGLRIKVPHTFSAALIPPSLARNP
jgi:hypothetical protein